MLHRAGDDRADLLDMAGGLGTGISELSDFLCDNSESFSGGSGPCSLNGGIDGNQIRRRGDGQDVFGQKIDLLHTSALFDRFIQNTHDFLRFRKDCFFVFLCGLLHLFRPPAHIHRVGGDCRAFPAHPAGIRLRVCSVVPDGSGVAGDFFKSGGQFIGQPGQLMYMVAGCSGTISDFSHDSSGAPGTVLKRLHGVPNRGDDGCPDDAESGKYKEKPCEQCGGAGYKRNKIYEGKAVSRRRSLPADRFVKGIDFFLSCISEKRYVAVGLRIGRLRPAVCTGTDKEDERVLKRVVIFQKHAVGFFLFRGDTGGVSGQLLIQPGLLFLDRSYQLDHGGMVSCNNVRQGQTMDLHHGTADIFQLCFADHMPVDNDPGIGVYVVDAKYRENI